MTVWIYSIGAGQYEETAVVENGAVVDGDEGLLATAFPEGIPNDEAEVARAFNGPATVASTDFEMDWTPDEPTTLSGRALLHGPADADALTQQELVWERLYEEVLWSDDTDRVLFSFSPEDVPEFVLNNLREAVQAGALFSDFETIPASAAGQLGDVLLDSLEESHGWSINSLSENIQDAAPGVDYEDAERIARTETQSLVSTAREEGYRDEFDLSEERFRWVGPDDQRTTDTCEAIKDRVGEDGVLMDELKDIIREEAIEHGHDPREFTPHVNCRHTLTRVVE